MKFFSQPNYFNTFFNFNKNILKNLNSYRYDVFYHFKSKYKNTYLNNLRILEFPIPRWKRPLFHQLESLNIFNF